MKRKSLIVLLLLSMTLSLSACGNTNQPDGNVKQESSITLNDEEKAIVSKMTKFEVATDNSISFTYDGVERKGLLFLPENAKDSSLIVMLHGSEMSMEQFIDMTKINEEALSRGYTLLYLQGVTNPDDKTSVVQWNNGTGNNPIDDLGFIQAAAIKVEEKYELNSDKTYVTGFSNGAFMVHTLAAEGSGTFEGFCSVAGSMQEHSWNNKKADIDFSFLEIFGLKDDAVPANATGTAKYAPGPAIEDVIDYYATSQNLSPKNPVSLSDKVLEYTYDSANSKNVIKGIAIKDCHHGWPDEKLTTFNTNDYILNFFDGLK